MTEPVGGRFTVNLNAEDNDRFDRLVRRLGEGLGRLPSHRGQRLPSRADLLRALLVVTEQNPHVERAAQEQVRADALNQVGIGVEIAAVADDLSRYLHGLSSAESRDHLTEYVIPELREEAAAFSRRPIETAAFLGGHAQTIARHGASYGGYELLRPMLELSRRLQAIRDAIDPREKSVCPRCAQLIRTTGEPGEPAPTLEVHLRQDGGPCRQLTA